MKAIKKCQQLLKVTWELKVLPALVSHFNVIARYGIRPDKVILGPAGQNTRDLKKLCDNAEELRNYFGETRVEKWIFVTPGLIFIGPLKTPRGAIYDAVKN